jgi:hypothetical protein
VIQNNNKNKMKFFSFCFFKLIKRLKNNNNKKFHILFKCYLNGMWGFKKNKLMSFMIPTLEQQKVYASRIP